MLKRDRETYSWGNSQLLKRDRETFGWGNSQLLERDRETYIVREIVSKNFLPVH